MGKRERNIWSSDEDQILVETLAECAKSSKTIDEGFELAAIKLDMKRTVGAIRVRWYSDLRADFNDIVGPFQNQTKNIWTNEEDEILTNAYVRLKEQGLVNKELWEMVAAQLPKRTPKACDQRYTKLVRNRKFDERYDSESNVTEVEITDTNKVEDGALVVAEITEKQVSTDPEVIAQLPPNKLFMDSLTNISTAFSQMQRQNYELESKLSKSEREKTEIQAKFNQLMQDFSQLQQSYSQVMGIIDTARKLTIESETGTALIGQQYKTNSKSSFLIEKA